MPAPHLLRFASTFLAALLIAAPSAAIEELVDRIVAVVDDDPIFLSDVQRAIGLGLAEPQEGESGAALRRRVLDELIERRLRLHEVERYGTGNVSPEEVDRQIAEIRSRYPSDARYRAGLDELGLDEEGLRHLLTRQLRELVYVEQRLAPRIFIDIDEMRTYYETELVAEMERQGAGLPPFDDVRDGIREVLRARRLNEEIEAWTQELWAAANVVDHLDRPPEALPPVVRRIEDE